MAYTRRAVSGLIKIGKWLEKFRILSLAAAVGLSAVVGAKMVTLIHGFTAALQLAKGAMLTFCANPLVAVLGAIAILVALLIDDFLTWKEGGESVIGDLVNAFPWVGEAITAIQELAADFIAFWMEQWDALKTPLMGLMQAIGRLVSVLFSRLWPIVKMVFKGWMMIMAAILPIIVKIATWIITKIVSVLEFVINLVGFLVDAFARAWESVGEGVDWLVGKFDAFVGKIKDVIGWASEGIGKVAELLGLKSKADNAGKPSRNTSAAKPARAVFPAIAKNNVYPNSSAPSNTANNTTNITIPNITVQSNDPNKAGKVVMEEIARQNRNSTRNQQSAVAY